MRKKQPRLVKAPWADLLVIRSWNSCSAAPIPLASGRPSSKRILAQATTYHLPPTAYRPAETGDKGQGTRHLPAASDWVAPRCLSKPSIHPPSSTYQPPNRSTDVLIYELRVLPLHSVCRISLVRIVKDIQLFNLPASFHFIVSFPSSNPPYSILLSHAAALLLLHLSCVSLGDISHPLGIALVLIHSRTIQPLGFYT